MALKKELIFNNGVNIKYHYISDIQIDGKNKITKLKVDSYTDETYREKEKANETNKERYNELLNLILDENKKEEKDRDTEKVVSWSDEANSLIDKFVDDLCLKVVSTDIELKDVTNFNIDNLYTLLKKEEPFTDSEDC